MECPRHDHTPTLVIDDYPHLQIIIVFLIQLQVKWGYKKYTHKNAIMLAASLHNPRPTSTIDGNAEKAHPRPSLGNCC